RFDFSTATDNLSDGILLIGDKKVHINKSILALHSPVFNTMFYGKFGDKTKEEMELKEVEHECLIERVERFLIDSSHMSIAYLLYLSDKYRLYLLQEHCLSKLEKTEDVKAVKNTEGYRALSDKARLALLGKMMKL
ncbi:hypothetical protein PENTCL1PPCAC_23835, partial [Pristionchus entomophagus]